MRKHWKSITKLVKGSKDEIKNANINLKNNDQPTLTSMIQAEWLKCKLKLKSKNDKIVDTMDEKDKLNELVLCPISLERMKNPSVVSPCGHTFEHSLIETIQNKGGTCPLCAQSIQTLSINYALKDILEALDKK